MPFAVRRLEAGEWPLFRDLRLAALADTPSAFWSTYEREVGHDPGDWQQFLARAAWFTVEVDGVPAGLAACGRMHDQPDEPDRQVIGMWVAPAARRRGAGAALLEAVVDQARAEGAPGVVLSVAIANEPAKQLYASLGFVDTGGRGELPHDPPVPEMELRRQLDTGR